MRIDNEEILSMTDDDWSEIIREIGYPHIPTSFAEKRKVYLDYLNKDHKPVREEVTK